VKSDTSDIDARPDIADGAVPVVELRGIRKRFAGVHALKGVDVDIHTGTIHAVLGENGAGKSTLIKIIAGALRRDSGTMKVRGQEVHYRSPRAALVDGIAVIAQELELVPDLTVAANLLLGAEPSRGGFIARRALHSEAARFIAESGFGLDPDARVGELGTAQQQQVEILRAIMRDAHCIIMDEPTAALTGEEAEKLHNIVRALREAGKTVVYVSHFLDEVLELADTVTVLRNGELVRTAPAEDETVPSLVTAMLATEASLAFPPKRFPAEDSPVVLSVRNLSRAGTLSDISLDVRAGEIVGLAGLLGSGRSELALAIFGTEPTDSGIVEVKGEELSPRSPNRAIETGLTLLPESRKENGLVMGLSVAHNITLPHLGTMTVGGFVDGAKERRATSSMMERLDITARSPRAVVDTLSGGNQQKVLFGKCLLGEPDVLMLDEPTRGVDVGAKLRIHELIGKFADRGMGVLLISSEIEEIIGLSHRVLVMRLGQIVAEFDGRSLSEDAVMRAAFGVHEDVGSTKEGVA
jgi:ABC-type sugar transport system ATPase subunit